MNWFKLKDNDRNFVGYLVIGFASLVGGIFMFFFIVLPASRPENGVPRDVQLIFTRVFSQQGLVRRETGKYSAALSTLGVEQDECRRYLCLMTLTKDAMDYTLQLSKDGQSWQTHSNSPMPTEINTP